MNVKTILKYASVLLDREDLIEFFSNSITDNSLTGDKLLLLNCYEFVQDNIFRNHLEYVYEQVFVNANPPIKYNAFTYSPIKILEVRNSSNEIIKPSITIEHVDTNETNVKIKYTCVPVGVTAIEESKISKIGISVIAYGVASEFCLVKGMFEEASAFNQKYTNGLKECLPLKSDLKIKSREWF